MPYLTCNASKMRKRYSILVSSSLVCLLAATQAFAQNTSPKPAQPETTIEDKLLSSIGVPQPKLTPLAPVSDVKSLAVKLLYDGPKLEGNFFLEIRLTKPNNDFPNQPAQLRSQSTVFLKTVTAETNALLNLTEEIDGLQIEATLRDTNQNLVLKTSHPIPVLSPDERVLRY